jgi:hypothetical protein
MLLPVFGFWEKTVTPAICPWNLQHVQYTSSLRARQRFQAKHVLSKGINDTSETLPHPVEISCDLSCPESTDI